MRRYLLGKIDSGNEAGVFPHVYASGQVIKNLRFTSRSMCWRQIHRRYKLASSGQTLDSTLEMVTLTTKTELVYHTRFPVNETTVMWCQVLFKLHLSPQFN